ncbi:hypothetical protein HMPREF1981_02009 [Bacteroides pyogenes F0041]|uniref:Uncharacterized protein n=1 Tax=Bacteroides pyogenes F0041 TaxID=1321819 RepID=U2DU11_9BACE|nr:hypothetical protein HMPREF1981_02009 [Bacteroides pyogenes F0041]
MFIVAQANVVYCFSVHQESHSLLFNNAKVAILFNKTIVFVKKLRNNS